MADPNERPVGTDKATSGPSEQAPPKPAEPRLTDEQLIARGWREAETPPDRGYFLPAPAEPKPPKPAANTRESLKALGFKRAEPTGRGFGLPAYVPPPKKKE